MHSSAVMSLIVGSGAAKYINVIHEIYKCTMWNSNPLLLNYEGLLLFFNIKLTKVLEY